MSLLRIREYIGTASVGRFSSSGAAVPIAQEPGVNQTVMTISGTHAESAPFGKNTRLIRVHTDAICSIEFGDSPVAGTGGCRLAANQTEYFGVSPGQKLSVVADT
jgi:hypothetical protein